MPAGLPDITSTPEPAANVLPIRMDKRPVAEALPNTTLAT